MVYSPPLTPPAQPSFATTQPIYIDLTLDDVRKARYGTDTLNYARGTLSRRDLDITGMIVSAGRLGNIEHYAHSPGKHLETKFGQELAQTDIFRENGTLPDELVGEFIRIIASLCPQEGTPNTYVRSIANGIEGFKVLKARVVDGAKIIAEAKLWRSEDKQRLSNAIVAGDAEELKRILRNKNQEESVQRRAKDNARALGVPEDTFQKFYSSYVMPITLEREVKHLLGLREELLS